METPQSIVTISNQVIRDQQLFTTTDIAKNVSGVTNVYPYVNIYTDFNIRGTRAQSNKLRNGMPVSSSYGTLQEDMSYVENVEFIKGPAGFMLAQGEPGGMYNVVTKKPLSINHTAVSFNTGSFGLLRGSLDIGGPLGKKVFYRVNAMGQNSGTHLDYGINDRISIAPVVRYEINDKTALTLEYNFDRARNNGSFTNLPSHNKQFLRRSFAIDDPAMDPVTLTSQVIFINLQHQVNEQWKFTAQLSHLDAAQDGSMFFAGTWVGLIDSAGNLPRAYRYMAVKNKGTTGQLFLNGNVHTGKTGHKLLIGFDGGQFNDKWKFADVYNVLPINIYKPVYGLAEGIDTLVDESSLIWQWPSQTSWQAISVQDDIKLLPWLQLTLGGRYTFYQYGYDGEIQKDNVFTPRAGLVVMPLSNTSAYFLYDQSFLPQNGHSYEGEQFKPMRGNNLEIGLKREWFGKRLFTQLAVYNITKNNVLTADPQNPGFSIQRGQVKSKGIELDIMGSVNRNLSIIANYAYTDAKVTKDTDPLVIGNRESAPMHATNLWIKYNVNDGTLKGLGFGAGGSLYLDQYGWTARKNPDDAPMTYDYKSLNAAIYYTIGGLTLSLNGDNLIDEYNFIFGGSDYNLGKNGEYDYISQPGRTIRLAATYSF